jgi:hypothetical protein
VVPADFLLIHFDTEAGAFWHSPPRPARAGQRRFQNVVAHHLRGLLIAIHDVGQRQKDVVGGSGGDAELNYKGVTAMFRHVFNMTHVKTVYASENGKVYEVDLARLFGLAKKAGYRDYFSMEADMPGDPFVNTRKLVDATLQYLS